MCRMVLCVEEWDCKRIGFRKEKEWRFFSLSRRVLLCERMGWYSGHKEKRMGLRRTLRRAGCSIREVDLVSRISSFVCRTG